MTAPRPHRLTALWSLRIDKVSVLFHTRGNSRRSETTMSERAIPLCVLDFVAEDVAALPCEARSDLSLLVAMSRLEATMWTGWELDDTIAEIHCKVIAGDVSPKMIKAIGNAVRLCGTSHTRVGTVLDELEERIDAIGKTVDALEEASDAFDSLESEDQVGSVDLADIIDRLDTRKSELDSDREAIIDPDYVDCDVLQEIDAMQGVCGIEVADRDTGLRAVRDAIAYKCHRDGLTAEDCRNALSGQSV